MTSVDLNIDPSGDMAAPTSEPYVVCRSLEGIQVFGASNLGDPRYDLSKDSQGCSCMRFSKDGCLLAWCNSMRVAVFSISEGKTVFSHVREKPVGSSFVAISPRGTFVVSWTPASSTDKHNLYIWNVATGALLASLLHKKGGSWEPKWSADETVFIRNINSELHFYEKNDFNTAVLKLQQQTVAAFSVGACGDQCMVATYEPGNNAQSQPDHVRIYQYPNISGLSAARATASFFKGEHCSLRWNCLGTALLALKSTATSATSYYGDQSLHFLTTANLPMLAPTNSCIMSLDKKGPIPDAVWTPSGKEFCVVYGLQPAKAALFGLRAEKLFDFQEGPRNCAFFNPQGNILCLAAFGSIRGKLAFWDLDLKKVISETQDAEATGFEWCPDGERFLTTVTSPKLKVNNRHWVYTYCSGRLLAQSTDYGCNLFEATWCPVPAGSFPAKAVVYKAILVPDNAPAQPVQPSKQLYRPPHKNYSTPGLAPAAATTKDRPSSAKLQSAAPKLPGDERLKKLKKLQQKLDDIHALKEKVQRGQQLEKNQLEKIKTEDDVLQQLEQMHMEGHV